MPRLKRPSKLGLAFSVVGVIGYTIAGGIILGYYMDRWLNTSPWLSITGLIVGTIGAFTGLYRIMNQLNRND